MLVVGEGGSRSWIQRIQIGGRRIDRGLGPYPAVTLASATREVGGIAAPVEGGRRSPFAAKPVEPMTLAEGTIAYVRAKVDGWTTPTIPMTGYGLWRPTSCRSWAGFP